MVEQLPAWCATSDALTDMRSKARTDFFGYDEPGTIKYVAQTGEVNARERRFMGWFGFYFRLPDGTHPAEMAAAALLSGSELVSALKSIRQARFVMAMVTSYLVSTSFKGWSSRSTSLEFVSGPSRDHPWNSITRVR
jgi:hypothetical protein